MAANVMSVQMQLAQTMDAHMHAAMAEMPCHHDAMKHEPASQDAQPHHCAVCGYCVISSGAATLHFSPTGFVAQARMPMPQFVSLPVHSQTYPPAIRPPIFS